MGASRPLLFPAAWSIMEHSERMARYDAWLEAAERKVMNWLAAAGGEAAGDPVDIRALGAAVTILRTIIDIRKKLMDLKTHEPQSAEARSQRLTEGEILKLIERCNAGAPEEEDEGEVPA